MYEPKKIFQEKNHFFCVFGPCYIDRKTVFLAPGTGPEPGAGSRPDPRSGASRERPGSPGPGSRTPRSGGSWEPLKNAIFRQNFDFFVKISEKMTKFPVFLRYSGLK